MRRRELLTTGAIGTVMGAVAAGAEGAQGSAQSPDRALDLVREAIEHVRADLRADRQFTEIAPVRAAQKSFLRTNGKLPDVLELGADPWFAVYDWHVRWQHPLVEGRDGQGRLTLAMNGTQVVLRPDVSASYVGQPYDVR